MCGIAGVIATDPARDVGPTLERLTAELKHRGPDGSGLRFLRGRWAGFGHRRLSIVDLECGAQPMTNEDERVWVVMNGELYNHLELRRELERLGHSFRTRADTEVLVHGWEEWGSAVLERTWFTRWVAQGAESYLLGREAKVGDLLRAEPARQLIGAVRERSAAHPALLSLYVLETWLRGIA